MKSDMTPARPRGRPSDGRKVKLFLAYNEVRHRHRVSKAEFARIVAPGLEADGHFAKWDDRLPRDIHSTHVSTIVRYITEGERMVREELARLQAEVAKLRAQFLVGGLFGLGAYAQQLDGGSAFREDQAPLPRCFPEERATPDELV